MDISIPWSEVEQETQRVVKAYKKQVRIPGFRPGKAPESVIQVRYGDDVRREVLESLAPKHFWKEAQAQDYRVIGQPNITDVHYEKDEPLTFKAKFEIIPDFELADYRRLQVPYKDPEVADEEVQSELERLREQHASFRNVDPRPIEEGDIAVISLKSGEVEGVPAVDQSETTLTIGGEETLEDFSKALKGKSPDDEVDFEVTYPEDFGNEKLAGKAVPFHAVVKGVRVKELPELDDEFAGDVGDFQTIDELKSRIKEEITSHKRRHAIEHSHEAILDKLIEMNNFAVPDRLVNEQIRTRLERTARSLAEQGVDLEQMQLDWGKLGETERPRAVRDVKAGLLLERIAEAEAIEADDDEIDAAIERFAQSRKSSLSRARQQMSEDGTLDRLRSHMINEKTLNYLFDEAEKVDPPEPEPEPQEAEQAAAPAEEEPEKSAPVEKAEEAETPDADENAKE